MRVLVVGLGYVGSVQAAALAARGHEVTGIDVDPDKVNRLRSGTLSIFEPGLQEFILSGLPKGCLRFFHSSEIDRSSFPVIFVAVGTPSSPFSGNADLSQVHAAIQWIKGVIENNALIVMKSTVPPGTGQCLIKKHLRESRFSYLSNPEFLREGQAVHDWIGNSFLKAGIGYGGSCFPKDVRALDFFSSMNGYSFELLKSVISVNNRQRSLPVKKIRECIGDLNGTKVTVLGLAFKPNTDDTREAPAINIINMLLHAGCEVRAYDPVAMEHAKKVLPPEVEFCHNAVDAIRGAQAAIVATEWDEFITYDWCALNQLMSPPRLIIDGRNVLPRSLVNTYSLNHVGIGPSNGANRQWPSPARI